MAEWRRLCGESCSHALIPAVRARRHQLPPVALASRPPEAVASSGPSAAAGWLYPGLSPARSGTPPGPPSWPGSARIFAFRAPLRTTRRTRCPECSPRSAISAAQASSTRRALCSSSRTTARCAAPGVGVGGGDQGPGLVPIQVNRGGAVRVHCRPGHALGGDPPVRSWARAVPVDEDSADRRRRTLEAAAPPSSQVAAHRSTCTGRPPARGARAASQPSQAARSPA